MLLRRLFVVLALALALCAPAAADARTDHARAEVHWIHIHLHLNAYAHWGACHPPGSTADVKWDDHAGVCAGKAEMGQLGGVSILTHSSPCHWIWDGNNLRVVGVDTTGQGWVLEGHKSHNFWDFAARTVRIGSTSYTTGGLTEGSRGEPGGPLKVYLGSHWSSAHLSWGYSMNLQGYVRVTQ